MGHPQIILASNRGPVSFERDRSGQVVPKRGGGGLVTALAGALQRSGGLWMASAISREDREMAARGRLDLAAEDTGYGLRYLAFAPKTYERYYNGISNRVLWFLHHYLWDVPRAPLFDSRLRQDWSAYRQVNEAFAAALDEEGGRRRPLFLVQDYHLSLVPAMLRERRPRARIAHFSHIPFTDRSYLRILPEDIRSELVEGLLGADLVGFQARAWADNFLMACRDHPEARVDLRSRRIRWNGRTVRVGVYPISIDPEALEDSARAAEVARAGRRITRWTRGARLIVRVDRTELSKNILRGFLAYEAFLRRHPSWKRGVVFLALLNSSRGSIPEYRDYLKECLRAAGRINTAFGDETWEPIHVAVGDHLPTVLAAYRMYDALLVNPVYDGMNLVAKEGPILNRKAGVLVLSENAGAFSELGEHALCINPFDVEATGEALATALTLDEADRREMLAGLQSVIRGNTAEGWVRHQLDDLKALGGGS